MEQLSDHPHRRRNPLTREWVLVSPHRTKRPWQGRTERTEEDSLPPHDPDCYLCAGNTRAGGIVNPDYKTTFVFDNDFAALLPPEELSGGYANPADSPSHDLFHAEPDTGVCRVICFSPRHDLSLARMEPEDIEMVVDTWCDEYADLGAREDIGHVQIFENRGALMGCSNPHPHGQIWATRTMPDIPASENRNQRAYKQGTGGCMLCDYVEEERKRGERIVFETEHFVTLVPFWAVWPFETMVLPKAHMQDITAMEADQREDLAWVLKRLGIRYDNLFDTSFPYSMGIHQRPTTPGDFSHWHWHIHYYPPLLRSATVRKFMVGFEMLGMPQRDLTPEQAAERLRNVPYFHYLDRPAQETD